ncbi:hypothetical protein B0H66DRAFT_536562 [Apodospora peruviana]|uniref:Uncharacterized protein n=1 Tax=Apodospora peruviana TaxID=516989 RepID=A0AAE0HVH1_9PEZI|nr:hypothetical protein B0H66DRAFT_536562 [Apodospora peruviana]
MRQQAEAAITAAAVGPPIMSSMSSIVMHVYNPHDDVTTGRDYGKSVSTTPDVFSPVPISEITVPLAPGYNSTSYLDRVGRSARFVIARPYFFVFAYAKDEAELAHCLR